MKVINEIWVEGQGRMTVFGELAHKLYFHDREQIPQYRCGRNHFIVLEAPATGFEWVMRAGQSTREDAIKYMAENRVLINLSEARVSNLEFTRENFTPSTIAR